MRIQNQNLYNLLKVEMKNVPFLILVHDVFCTCQQIIDWWIYWQDRTKCWSDQNKKGLVCWDIFIIDVLSLWLEVTVLVWSVLRNVLPELQSYWLTVDIAEREESGGRQITGGTSVPETQLFPDSPGGKTGVMWSGDHHLLHLHLH